MNGPQHYREAERLLDLLDTATCADADGNNPEGALLIAEAQVHAMLAQVAVAIDTTHHVAHWDQWTAATKEK